MKRVFALLLLAVLASGSIAAQAQTFRSASTNATESTSIVVTTPSGAASGDVLATYCLSDSNGDTISASAGGWTAGPTDGTVDVTLTTFYRTLSAAPPANYTFTDNINPMVCGMIAIDPEGGTDPVVAVNGTTNEGSADSVTPVIANVADPRVFIAVYGNDSGFTVSTPPASMTGAHALMAPGAYAMAAYYQVDPADVGNIARTLTWSGTDTAVATGFLISFTAGGGVNPVSTLQNLGKTFGPHKSQRLGGHLD